VSTQSIPQTRAQDRVNRTALAVQICILMVMLIVFNVYPEKVGVYRTALDPASFTPLLAPGFYEAMPWLNAWWVLALGLALVLLFFEHWTGLLRVAELAMDLFGVLVLCRLLAGAPLLVPDLGWDWSLGGHMTPFGAWPLWSVNTLVQLALSVALFGQVVGAVGKLGRLLPNWRPSQSGATRS
jgi:hypothetical protein